MSRSLPLRPLQRARHILPVSSTLHSTRTFATSSCRAAIGPEDPRFIEVPASKQPTLSRPRVIKGVLPAPRPIFTRHDTAEGVQAKILASAPSGKSTSPSTNPRTAHKQRLAAQRRANLAAGFTELWQRKQRKDKALAAEALRKRRAREAALYAPFPDDEWYTATTTLANHGLGTGFVSKGSLKDVIDRRDISKQKTKKVLKRKEDAKTEALHTLYMHARSFITNERDLDVAVEREFSKYAHDESIMSIGPPETIAERLQATSGSRDATDPRGDKHVLVGKRMKKVAEIVTGGQMD